MSTYIRWFSQIGMADVPSVGGKNASLGEMYRELTSQGVNVPGGFAITADAYWRFIRESQTDQVIKSQLAGLDFSDLADLRRRASAIRRALFAAPLPSDLAAEITAAYVSMGGNEPDFSSVAVRSSATAEDLPHASFAGQQETYLNVRGEHALLDACKRCFASLFTDRAISYRADQGFDHLKIALSIGVQHMVRADLASSGVMFTIDTETGFRDTVLINASYGLGENIVQGTINPDEYIVFKPTLKVGFRPILQRQLGSKEFRLVFDEGGEKGVRNVPVPPDLRGRFALGEEDILKLARWACLIEAHYSRRRGQDTPMDIEWAKDGLTGELFIVQARPETVQSRRPVAVAESYRLQQRGPILTLGRSVGEKIATGTVRIIHSAKYLDRLKAGEILVTDRTDPDWEPVMKKAAAIVTNRGGRTCHAAIVSRELGLPAIVGTENATDVLRDGQAVTVSCAEGDAGYVYEGKLPFEIVRTTLAPQARPQTKVMMNVGNPEQALSLSLIPNDGVGLARMEFIVSHLVKIHPLALLAYDGMPESETKHQIESLTRDYAEKSQYFVDKLAEGAAMIAAAFYPKDVILRMSDFKTNEYANLIGGAEFEPREENPIIGFRGASRYYHPRYQAGFALECQAVKKVREDMGLTNLKIMIPFCRTIEEGRKVHAELEKNGLSRGRDGLDVYVMCEIPSNVILADQFADIFDGFSIGSNDLTQLILGVDRDSEIVASIFDERNEAVKTMIAQVIATCRRRGRKIGICGQAPSDYPEFAKFLVEAGIDSISLNPDTVVRTTAAILECEKARVSPSASPADAARTPVDSAS